jgi:hypothetical protein
MKSLGLFLVSRDTSGSSFLMNFTPKFPSLLPSHFLVLLYPFFSMLNNNQVQELEDYYSIDGEHYNCYIYAKYLHGNNKMFNGATTNTLSISSMFYNMISSCWRLLKYPAYTVCSAYASLRVKSS